MAVADPQIDVRNLWLSYRQRGGPRPTLKDFVGTLGATHRRPQRWALRDVSFSVSRGEVLGIIGANGSGKSSLLRCLAGIYRPTRGAVETRGRTASLIDLTAGLEGDLTARDNIFLAGAIYGVPKDVLRARSDSILSFAGLTEHSGRPLRSFSLGMAMRLGFSLAVSLDPDLLLIDEVLAVGDESFKIKCLDRVSELRNTGTTVVFVSHELALVQSFSDRVMQLHEGEVVFDGGPTETIENYCASLGIDIEAALTLAPVQFEPPRPAERKPWSRRH